MGAPPKGSACSTLKGWESNRLARRYACSHQLHRGTSGRDHLPRLRRPRATQIARCSTHHFQQMFSHHTGVPLPGNVRHRRPTLIAFELRAGKCMVIDAPQYGSEPPKASNRALKNCTAVYTCARYRCFAQGLPPNSPPYRHQHRRQHQSENAIKAGAAVLQ